MNSVRRPKLRVVPDNPAHYGVELVFENQPKTLSPQQAADLIGLKRMTIYDMHYRPHKYGVTHGTFMKVGKNVRVITEKLKEWLISQQGEKHEF